MHFLFGACPMTKFTRMMSATSFLFVLILRKSGRQIVLVLSRLLYRNRPSVSSLVSTFSMGEIKVTKPVEVVDTSVRVYD